MGEFETMSGMTEVVDIAGPPAGNEPPEVSQVVAFAENAAKSEFDRAERFDRKALNLATVVGAFFSLSQIVVVNAISTDGLVPGSWHDELRWVGIGATLAAAVSVSFALLVFWAREERSSDLDKIKSYLAAAQRGNRDVTRHLVFTYQTIAEDRRESNRKRSGRYRTASWLAVVAVAITGVELGMVLYAITL